MQSNEIKTNEYLLLFGDALSRLDNIPENSVDTIITDPPYELGFMGSKWDSTGIAFNPELWKKALNAAKPGAILLAFGGTRTFHRLTCAIEDAGWEIKDCMQWLYGTGMPKGIDMAKAVGKIRPETRGENGECTEWYGWNSTLKPSWEPIIVAMKPSVNTFAQNAVEYGVAGFNINGSRNKHKNKIDLENSKPKGMWTTKKKSIGATPDAGRNIERVPYDISDERKEAAQKGRYPTNTILLHHDDCKMVGKRKVKGTKPHPVYSKVEKYEGWGNITQKSGEVVNRFEDLDGFETIDDWECHEDCPVRILDEQSGILTSGTGAIKKESSTGHIRTIYGAENRPYGELQLSYGDTGGASRFFYTSKASPKERNLGLPNGMTNDHKTVKPLKLMQYLCGLTKTPTGGTVLDIFMGSGTTGMACAYTGRKFIGIDNNIHHFELGSHRVEFAYNSKRKTKTTRKIF